MQHNIIQWYSQGSRQIMSRYKNQSPSYTDGIYCQQMNSCVHSLRPKYPLTAVYLN